MFIAIPSLWPPPLLRGAHPARSNGGGQRLGIAMNMTDYLEKWGRTLFENPLARSAPLDSPPELAEIRFAVLEEVRRNSYRAGDAIYVSGALGGSALGLAAGRGRAWARHKRPEPRLALGRFLRARLGATAAMDLSDGLSLDLHRLCAASGLRAEIAPPPRYRGATLEQALHGGEDYELLFTAPERVTVPDAFEGLALTRIGTMRKGSAGAVEMDGQPLAPLGYDHLRHL